MSLLLLNRFNLLKYPILNSSISRFSSLHLGSTLSTQYPVAVALDWHMKFLNSSRSTILSSFRSRRSEEAPPTVGAEFKLLLPSRSTTRCLGSKTAVVETVVGDLRPPHPLSSLNRNTDEDRLEAVFASSPTSTPLSIDDDDFSWLLVSVDRRRCRWLVVGVAGLLFINSWIP